MGTGDVWFFDRVARVYDLVMPSMAPGVLANALSRADGPVARVIDVGGGTGRASGAVQAPVRVVVDASIGMLRRVPPEVGRVRADGTALPIAGGVADAVLIVDALHHLPRTDSVLAEAARALRPGGVLVVRDFDRSTLRGRLVAAGEHLLGMGSTFFTADGLAEQVAGVELDAEVVDRGFAFTVVGRKPGRP